MKFLCMLMTLTLLLSNLALAADPNDPAEYQEIIKRRCTLCHSQERIETAIRTGQDMNQILTKMLQMGATLTDREQKVLGTFWGSPVKD